MQAGQASESHQPSFPEDATMVMPAATNPANAAAGIKIARAKASRCSAAYHGLSLSHMCNPMQACTQTTSKVIVCVIPNAG